MRLWSIKGYEVILEKERKKEKRGPKARERHRIRTLNKILKQNIVSHGTTCVITVYEVLVY